jgi:hypothetical protein
MGTSMTRVLRITAWCLVCAAVLGYLGVKLLSWGDQISHRAEYDARLAITLDNISDPRQLDDPESSVRILSVNVVHAALPFRPWFIGYGVFLGDGLIVTAAHVIGRAFFLTPPRVLVAGQDLPAKVISAGTAGNIDLAILAVPQETLPISLRLRRAALCRGRAPAGARVLVAYPEKIAVSQIVPPRLVLHQAPRFDTFIDDVESSGAGVFDSRTKCLLGIVTEKFPKAATPRRRGPLAREAVRYAGYYVPSDEIRKMVNEYRSSLSRLTPK